ncbi:MAG: hypothetical protein M2R45_04925 [Verrucomicrobia subdivision 3 bacterium]|nr:hypothetical protein [Limisphaerales bacterium]
MYKSLLSADDLHLCELADGMAAQLNTRARHLAGGERDVRGGFCALVDPHRAGINVRRDGFDASDIA